LAEGEEIGAVRRVGVESSVIRSVGYERETATLEVEFQSEKVYRYFAVPRAVYEGLISAESAGAYFNERVRDRYPEERVSR
jgi:KTSC domain-containing protein